MNSKHLILLIATLIATTVAYAKGGVTLKSPDSKIQVEIQLNNGAVEYTVSYDGQALMEHNRAALTSKSIKPITRITSVKSGKHNNQVSAQFYRQAKFADIYNEVVLGLGGNIGITFRAYNDGVAYRFTSTVKGSNLIIDNETADFNFANDGQSWLAYSTNPKKEEAMAFQNIYTSKKLSEQKDSLAFLPVTVDCGVAKITLTESDLEAYPGMFVRPQGKKLKGVFAHYPAETDYYKWRRQLYVTKTEDYIARVKGTRSYPWRVMAVTTKDSQLPVNNLVYSLASPSRVADTSWIKPGKVAWDWWNDWGLKGVPFKAGINTDTYKYYIDFAAHNGLQYVILDEGWYDSKSGDIMNPIADINLPELIQYAHDRGVGIVLWAVFNVLDEHLQEACAKYAGMGVKGFKVDFLDRDDQTAVEMAYRIAAACAEHKLILDYHGFYKPTGLNRTYPNLLNIESVFGMEEMKWNNDKKDMPMYDVTFPFIRMMAGHVDYTPGAMRNATAADYQPIYYNPMSMGTRCHQLACYVVHDSPFTMLCDSPSNYDGENECVDFITSVPDVPDETKVLQGELGSFIVTAKRSGPNWYVGGLTNWSEKDIVLDFSFLEAGVRYKACIFTDGLNAGKNASDYATRTEVVTSETKLPIHMASGGGFAISLLKDYSVAQKPVTPPADKKVDKFYSKYVDADGIYVVASKNVEDSALTKTAEIIRMMLAKRPDVKDYMVKKGCYTMILGRNEQVMDMPEYAFMRVSQDSIDYWNRRARGFGGAPQGDYTASFGEENVLALPCDRYVGESIMVHEFAHVIHTVGICGVEPDFDKRLEACMKNAVANGLWNKTYALSDKYEYFAECVQSYFDCNRYSQPANGVHNSINGHAKLAMYDPQMYSLLSEYFYQMPLPLYNKMTR